MAGKRISAIVSGFASAYGAAIGQLSGNVTEGQEGEERRRGKT